VNILRRLFGSKRVEGMPSVNEIVRMTKSGELKWKVVRVDNDLFYETRFMGWGINLSLSQSGNYPFGVIFIKPEGVEAKFIFFPLSRDQQADFRELEESLISSKGIPEG
jgi:hypothetical protein